MRIKLNDPEHASELLEFLLGRMDCVATRVGEDELEASLLGSRQLDANRAELGLRLRAWQATRAGDAADARLL
jgi:hypothetical protein